MTSYTGGGLTEPVGSLAGQTIKFMNFTNYDVSVFIGMEQVDIIPAYQYLMMPNEPDLYLSLSAVNTTDYVYPYAYVAAKTFDDVLTYEIGSLIHFEAQAPGAITNVAGNMSITGTASVNIANTPSVSISGITPVSISTAAGQNIVNIGNTPTVAISGTPSVTLSGTGNTVTIGNTPAVTLSGSANSVNIGNTPSVTISGTPTVNVNNTSIAVTNTSGGSLTVAGTVNIGGTPAVTITSGTVSISGTPAVTLSGVGNQVNIGNTPAVTISGTPAVNVSNTSIAVTNTPTGSLTIAGQVNIGNSPAVTVTSGSVSISGTPAVTLSGTTNSVNIGNTPAVTISGTPQVNVANTSIAVSNVTGGSLTVAGQVNIGNTPAVTVSSGSVSITGTPTVAISTVAGQNNINIANTPAVTISGTPQVNVANTSISVTNTTGGSLTVAGTVNIGNTPAVTITGTPTVNIGNTPAVSISGTPNVAISSGSVNATIQNASLNSNITNAMLSTGPTAKAQYLRDTFSLLASGGTHESVIAVPEGCYDAIYLGVESDGSNLGSLTFSLSQLRYQLTGFPSSYDSPAGLIFTKTIMSQGDNINWFQMYDPVFFIPHYINEVVIKTQNNVGVALTDTFNFYLGLRYSSQTIANTSSAPAQIQGAASSFYTAVNFNVGAGSTIVPSGGYVTKMHVAYVNNAALGAGGCQLNLVHGGVVIDSVFLSDTNQPDYIKSVDYDFGAGIANNGFSITTQFGTGSVSGFAVKTTNNVGQQRTTTLV